MAAPVMDEGKMLGEALNVVKIQVQQMKRHLVCADWHSLRIAVLMVVWSVILYRNLTSLWMH